VGEEWTVKAYISWHERENALRFSSFRCWGQLQEKKKWVGGARARKRKLKSEKVLRGKENFFFRVIIKDLKKGVGAATIKKLNNKKGRVRRVRKKREGSWMLNEQNEEKGRRGRKKKRSNRLTSKTKKGKSSTKEKRNSVTWEKKE